MVHHSEEGIVLSFRGHRQVVDSYIYLNTNGDSAGKSMENEVEAVVIWGL